MGGVALLGAFSVAATLTGVVTAADEQAVEGRQTGRLGRPLSDCPARLSGELRRAWRAGWRLGHDEYVENREVWGAGMRAFGRGAAGRTR